MKVHRRSSWMAGASLVLISACTNQPDSGPSSPVDSSSMSRAAASESSLPSVSSSAPRPTASLSSTTGGSATGRSANPAATFHCGQFTQMLNVAPIGAGTTLHHTARQARAELRPSDSISGIRVFPAMVTDPNNFKVGLGPPGSRRVMWIVEDHNTLGTPRGPTPYPSGTVLKEVWLIDDVTLTGGGGFTCGVVSD